MNSRVVALAITVLFSVIGVVGDFFLKLASQKEQTFRSPWFAVGFCLYASTAFGWVFVMRHLKLGTIGVVYSVSMILLLTLVGVFVFRETLNSYEIAGMLMAVGALILLMRFS